MKAETVASIDRLADPANSSNALSVFTGILQKGASKKVDDYTVEFHLDAPNGNFPYMSSDNHNAVIIPASCWRVRRASTAPDRSRSRTHGEGASFVRNDYWAECRPIALSSPSSPMQPMILALQGGQVDIINQMPVVGRCTAQRSERRHHQPEVVGASAAEALR